MEVKVLGTGCAKCKTTIIAKTKCTKKIKRNVPFIKTKCVSKNHTHINKLKGD